jgi:hypothetical protein
MDELSKARSMPIPIKPMNAQYSLSKIQFDPIQNSPPSLWKLRLNKRIGETHLKNLLVK